MLVAPCAAYTSEAMHNLTHLERLEAASLEIVRTLMAEAHDQLMLLSPGRTHPVVLNPASKAFGLTPPPVPMHRLAHGRQFSHILAPPEQRVRKCRFGNRHSANTEDKKQEGYF